METFGERLARLREERGWDRRELDKRIKAAEGVSRTYEVGRSFPGYWNLLELAKQLDVSLNYLCLGEE
jgi:ribosome-binding protein aMBF1 (putative translation factor)